MDQKATIAFDPENKSLKIVGELLPDNPQVHDAAAELLNEADPPTVSVEFTNVNNVLSYSLTFSRSAPTIENSGS